MKRKNIIVFSAIANAGLLIILLISAVTTKENVLSSSSAKVASSILQEDSDGMVLEEKEEVKEEITYKLPKIEEKESLKKESLKIIVKKGDSLEKIAKVHNSSVSSIIKMNKMNSSFLKEGQSLFIPKEDIKEDVKETFKIKDRELNNFEYYIVKPGDNPWTISMKHHIKVDDLLKLNNLDNKKAKRLRPGDKLRIR